MTKLEIFDDVVDIMKHDASTCKDKTGGEVDAYRAKIKEDMTEEEFLFVMKSYLATFEVIAHVAFYNTKGSGRLNFGVQRYQDELYVTKVAKNSELEIGDRIVEVDGIPVKEFAEMHKEFLYGEWEERQGALWSGLLRFFHTITVVRKANGNREVLTIKNNGEWKERTPYFCKKLKDNVAYMYLADFGNEEEIQKMYSQNETMLKNSEFLVIDVRGNGGGSDSAYFPLLKYCLPIGKTLQDMDFEDDCAEVNYTERNCDIRLDIFRQYKQMEIPEETKAMFDKMEAEALENRGKGFVKDSSDFQIPIKGEEGPSHVYILTDNECGSSGDAFVKTMNISPRVTSVGRPTMGILDYSNLSMVTYGEYTFMYPTSRLLNIDKGICMAKNGVPVDVYIPWTPEFLERDVDLERVYALIEGRY